MRTAFFGYGDFGVAGVDALVASRATIAAVAVPGNRSGAGVECMREAAARQGVPLLVQPPRSSIAPFVDALSAVRPDLIVVWSYSMILPADVLQVPPLGAVNVHGGLLPQYRGPHVTQWAIINGEREWGVTLHYIDEGVDTGPIVADRRFALLESDDALSIRARMKDAGATLLSTWGPRLASGSAPRIEQDPAGARYWPCRTPEQGRLTWTMTAESISRLVRALAANWPGAFLEIAARRVTVRRAMPLTRLKPSAVPGQVVSSDASGVRVAAADGDVLIVEAALTEGESVSPQALAAMLGHVDA